MKKLLTNGLVVKAVLLALILVLAIGAVCVVKVDSKFGSDVTESGVRQTELRNGVRAENLYFDSNSPYTERVFGSIHDGSIVEYGLYFSADGIFIIQTFGNNDTMMTLYDDVGNKIETDDDGGYGYNSFMVHKFSSGIMYTVRILFNTAGIEERGKIVVVPTDVRHTYDELPGLASAVDTIPNLSLPNGRTIACTLTREETREINFRTNIKTPNTIEAMRIWLIDPRSTQEVITAGTGASDCLTAFTGDGVKGIVTTIEANIEYFVVIAGADMPMSAGMFDLLL